MIRCPKCDFEDDPHWKPYWHHLYWWYADQRDFQHLIPKKIRRKLCKAGNFYYHFEDDCFYYRLGGKTRKIIYRFPKGRESMVNPKLFEKTPSEKATFLDMNQRVLFSEGFSAEKSSAERKTP